MPVEIELKLRVDSHEPVRDRLEHLDATRIGVAVETNQILDRPDGALRGQGCGLRVRIAQDQGTGEPGTGEPETGELTTTLTFKGPRTSGVIKSREEIETVVADSAELVKILGRLGFVSILEYQKRRESWTLDGCRIELDTPAILGKFVEIEGDSEDSIRAVQQKLHLGDAFEEGRSYVAMLISYCEQVAAADRVFHIKPK